MLSHVMVDPLSNWPHWGRGVLHYLAAEFPWMSNTQETVRDLTPQSQGVSEDDSQRQCPFSSKTASTMFSCDTKSPSN